MHSVLKLVGFVLPHDATVANQICGEYGSKTALDGGL